MTRIFLSAEAFSHSRLSANLSAIVLTTADALATADGSSGSRLKISRLCLSLVDYALFCGNSNSALFVLSCQSEATADASGSIPNRHFCQTNPFFRGEPKSFFPNEPIFQSLSLQTRIVHAPSVKKIGNFAFSVVLNRVDEYIMAMNCKWACAAVLACAVFLPSAGAVSPDAKAGNVSSNALPQESSNPYAIIIDKNIFRLNPPPPPAVDPGPPVEVPVVKLTGFMKSGHTTRVLMSIPSKDPKVPDPAYFNLAEGEHAPTATGDLELVKIFAEKEEVQIIIDNTAMTLSVKSNSYVQDFTAPKPGMPSPGAPGNHRMPGMNQFNQSAPPPYIPAATTAPVDNSSGVVVIGGNGGGANSPSSSFGSSGGQQLSSQPYGGAGYGGGNNGGGGIVMAGAAPTSTPTVAVNTPNGQAALNFGASYNRTPNYPPVQPSPETGVNTIPETDPNDARFPPLPPMPSPNPGRR